MEENTILARVASAFVAFRDKEQTLFQVGISERSITHHLARYIEIEFEDQGFNVDCEYNKSRGRPKQFDPSSSPGAAGLHKEYKRCRRRRNTANSGEAVTVYPDIIVHRRQLSDISDNLIAIEIKKRRRMDKCDRCKLRAFTSGIAVDFRYQYGLFLG